MVAFGEHQFQNQPAIFLQFFILGLYNQTIPRWIGTGWHRPSFPLDFDYAHAASADIAQSFEVAKRWQVNTVSLTYGKNSIAFLSLNLFTVDCQSYLFH
jgi:hypothetical protein